MANPGVEPSNDVPTIIEDILKSLHLVEDKMLRAGLDKAIYPVRNKRGV